MSRTPLLSLTNNTNQAPDIIFLKNRSLVTKAYKVAESYTKIAESTGNMAVLRVLQEISEENRIHVLESMDLLYELVRDEDRLFAHGKTDLFE